MFFALWNMLISKVCSKQKLSRGSVSALEPKLCEPGGEREQGKKNTSRDMMEGEGGEEQPLVSRENPSRKWKFRLCPHPLRWACWLTPVDLSFHLYSEEEMVRFFCYFTSKCSTFTESTRRGNASVYCFDGCLWKRSKVRLSGVYDIAVIMNDKVRQHCRDKASPLQTDTKPCVVFRRS